jgi:protein DJ-1
VTAICASPIALCAAEIGFKKRLTSYPSFKKELQDSYQYVEDSVVVDGKMITSRGPGTAFDFAYTLVGVLVNDDVVKTLKSGMLVK